jgi:hypothetical protein
MYAWENPPRYQVGKKTIEAGTVWYAGTIVHDACHSQLYHDYLFKNQTAEVPYNEFGGEDSERKCLNVQLKALEEIGAEQEILDYVKDLINSPKIKYHTEPRWW